MTKYVYDRLPREGKTGRRVVRSTPAPKVPADWRFIGAFADERVTAALEILPETDGETISPPPPAEPVVDPVIAAAGAVRTETPPPPPLPVAAELGAPPTAPPTLDPSAVPPPPPAPAKATKATGSKAKVD